MNCLMYYDVAVIGAGHAGIEAGLASARLGVSTIVFSINLDSIGNCPCSPSIGGTATLRKFSWATPVACFWDSLSLAFRLSVL